MRQEGFELRRSHKQNEVGGFPLPFSQPSICMDLEKPPRSSSAATDGRARVSAAGRPSLGPRALCRRQYAHTDMQTLPKAIIWIASGTKAVAYYKERFCTRESFWSFYYPGKWPAEKSAAFSSGGRACILSVSALCSTIEPLWCSPENLFMHLDFEHSFLSLASFTIVFEPLW